MNFAKKKVTTYTYNLTRLTRGEIELLAAALRDSLDKASKDARGSILKEHWATKCDTIRGMMTPLRDYLDIEEEDEDEEEDQDD